MENIVGNITENNEAIEGHISEAVVTANPATVRNTDSSYDTTVACGGTLVVPDSNISNSDGSYNTDLPATTDLILPNSKISNSDGSFSNEIPATTNLVLSDINVSNIGGTFAVTHPSAKDYSIPNTPISNSDDSFQVSLPSAVAHELSDVTHTDSDGSNVVYPSAKPFVCTPATTPSGWYQPSYWPSGWENEITDSDNGFVALVAVWENVPSYVAFKLFLTANGGTIDWGDGSSAGTLAHNALIEHEFDYASIPTAVTSQGYKIAKVVIKTTGDLWGFLGGQWSSYYGIQYYTAQPFLAIKLRSQYSKILYTTLMNGIEMAMLEYIDLGDTELYESNAGYSYNGFWRHYSLKKLITGGWQSVGNWGYLTFVDCDISGFDINNFCDWSKCERLYQTFLNCTTSGGNRIFSQSLASCDSLFYAFQYSRCFSIINLTDTGSITNLASTIQNSGVFEFTMDDCSAVTNTSNFVSTSNGNGHLHRLIMTGLTVGINISYHKLDATALNALFTSLGTASGSQTITVTGNPGAATCDTSIATAKGFTVTT